MLPSQAWFPTSIAERAAWFNNFARNFSNIGLSLGFSAAEIAQVEADNEVVQFLAGAIALNNNYTRALQMLQKTLTQGRVGEPTPELPAPPTFTPPPLTPPGIFARLNRTVKRVRFAPNYTDEAGALLGIIPGKTLRVPTHDHVPKVNVATLPGGYRFAVRVAKLRMDAFEVQVKRNSNDRFEPAAIGTASPLEVALTPLNPGEPEQIYVRVRMIKANKPVGLYSDLVQVTVNP
jgi:hypothetical protein